MDDLVFFQLLNEHSMRGGSIAVTEDDSKFRVDWLYRIEKDGRAVPTRLKRALDRAVAAEAMIPREIERLEQLLAEAKGRKIVSQVEIDAREYQIWYVEMYLKRAASLARERLDYFAEITTEDIAQRENELCRQDKRHWFKYYAWGYDPRARTPLSTVPFDLFPRQAELVDWLDEIVFRKRTSGLIEKSRDEGATELMVRWGVHNLIYTEGFSMLLSSRTEDEVDTKKKQGTLFSRCRFQISLLPSWMLPAGFDPEKDMLGHMIIANPANDNALQGQPPVENMGRGDRVTCAMFDEFAFWRFGGYPQHTSMSQTTDSIIMPSSVAGELNQYADLAHDGVTERFEMDWRDNPFKDERWYNALGYGYISPKMSSVAIAQEIDRNYKASQPGKVWKYSEPHMLITWSELVGYYKQFGLASMFVQKREGELLYSVPPDWTVTRTHDYGKSEGHDWGYLLGAQPREIHPLHDTHFIFLARNLEPTGLTEEEAVAQWRELETRIGVRRPDGKWRNKPKASWHSHEQKTLRKVLLGTYGETWIPWDTSYETGLTTLQDWFTPIDKDKPNPFRPQLMGRTKIVFVAPDSEYRLAFNERLKQWFVTTSTTEDAFYTLRRQIGAYHYPQSELGKAPKDMRPEKVFDDIVDALRGYAVNWNRNPDPPTSEEKVEMHMPDAYKLTELRKKNQGRKGLTDGQQIARTLMEEEVRERLKIKRPKPAWMEDTHPDEIDLNLGDGW